MSSLLASVFCLALISLTSGFLLDGGRPCSVCDGHTEVSLMIKDMQKPDMHLAVSLNTTRKELIFIMQEAAETNNFNFTVSYKSNKGFVVDAINGVVSDSEAQWYVNSITSGKEPDCQGISSYVPGLRETIEFVFSSLEDEHYKCPEFQFHV